MSIGKTWVAWAVAALTVFGLTSQLSAEVPDAAPAQGGYTYSPDHPLRSRPISPSIRAIANQPANLATPEDASIASAPLGMRFFIDENSNCRNPNLLVKLSYPRLIYELMEPQRLHSKMYPVSEKLRRVWCRQSYSEPWHASFTVTSNGKLIGSYRLDVQRRNYRFSEVQINWAAIDDTVVPYIDAFWKTGVVPDYEPEIKAALLKEGSAEANLVLGMRDQPGSKQTSRDFFEPYISQAIALEHPRAAYRVANAMITEFGVLAAATRGRQVRMPQKDKDALALMVAKAYRTRYIPSYIQASLLRQQGIDVDRAIEVVKQVGPAATLEDFYSTSVDLPPNWAQVRDGLRAYQARTGCSQIAALNALPENANTGFGIMALGSAFESGPQGCRVTNNPFNTSISIGISTVRDLSCGGGADRYDCRFTYFFDCGMSATGGVDLGILNPCSALSSIPNTARATLERNGRSWSVVAFEPR